MQAGVIIAYVSFGSILLPILIALFDLKRTWTDLRLLCLILILSLASDLLSLLFIRYSINTYIVGNIYLITQFAVLALMFRKNLPYRLGVDTLLILATLLCIVNLTNFQGPWIFNSFSNVVASLALIGLCMFYFYRLINDLPIVHIQHLPMLWITFGVLTYYAGNFFLFLVNNYLTLGVFGSQPIMWILHNLLNIIKNVLFAIALWQTYRRVKSSTLSSLAP
jgi:hypothetical protein